MEITYDPEKRRLTLEFRAIDFRDAAQVFAGPEYTVVDDRADYGEERYQTYGLLQGRLVQVVWTPRGYARHVMSMRKCNDRERTRFEQRLGRP